MLFLCPQIGRSSESPIDFVVMDTVAGDKSGDTKVLQSTISRFACRIIADRNDVNNCRIYAAGFDSSRNIFLGVSDPQFYRKTCWTQIVLYKMPKYPYKPGLPLCLAVLRETQKLLNIFCSDFTSTNLVVLRLSRKMLSLINV